MTKVAVGVRVKDDVDWATIKEVLPNGTFLVEWDEYGPGVVLWRESDFHFDQPNDPRAQLSPIVTVRHLEPGVYGLLRVDTYRDQMVVSIDPSDGHQPTAPELRELARVALEIAEYLDAQ